MSQSVPIHSLSGEEDSPLGDKVEGRPRPLAKAVRELDVYLVSGELTAQGLALHPSFRYKIPPWFLPLNGETAQQYGCSTKAGCRSLTTAPPHV